METHQYANKEVWQMLAELVASQKETEKKFQETDKFLKSIGKQLGNIGANNGAVAEDFFFYGFTASMQVDGIKYDYIERNKERVLKKLRGEYDIVLVNGAQIMVVEVKYKFHPNDVNLFYEKKLPKFKQLFPEHKDYKIYGAVAGLSIPDSTLEQAEKYGLMCFTQAGDNIKKISSQDMVLTEF